MCRRHTFSIIIPVYNAGNYLKIAIESILHQDYAEWELILIDDGSTDGSSKFCDDFAKKDKRIRVFHQKNSGVSAARNTGIKAASGEWILFLDSDDYFEENALHILNEKISDKDVDMVIFNHYVDIEENKYKHTIKLTDNRRYDRGFINKKILPGMLNTCDMILNEQVNILPFVWNKAYKREFLRKYQIMFNEELSIWEDKVFWLLYMKNIKSLLFIERGLYHYVQAEKERLSGKYVSEIFENVVLIFNILKDDFGSEFDMDSLYSNEHYYKVIDNLIYRVAESNKYNDFSYVIRETLCLPQIKKWILNASPKVSKNMTNKLKNKKYDSIARNYWLRMKIRKNVRKVNVLCHRVVALVGRRRK